MDKTACLMSFADDVDLEKVGCIRWVLAWFQMDGYGVLFSSAKGLLWMLFEKVSWNLVHSADLKSAIKRKWEGS